MKILICLGLISSVGLFAQAPGGRGARGEFPGFEPMATGGPVHTVTGAPYSAVEVTTTQQTLSDGNVIQSQQQSNVYRDSQGRVRTETSVRRPGASGSTTSTTMVMIHDPVAGVMRHIDAESRTVNETAIHQNQDPRNANAGAAVRPTPQRRADPNVTTADIGTQMVNGVPATGSRITRTIPAGTIGNTQPIQTVREVWTSVDLKVPVLIKTSDPRFGTTITQLTNISRSEPDATLFQAPAGYTVHSGATARQMGRGPRKD